MAFFKNKKKGVPPHTSYPEILHWKEGDTIKSIDYGKMESKNKFQTFLLRADGITPMTTYIYKSITEDGFIIIEEQETNRLYKIRFEKFVKEAQNISFNNRTITETIVQSSRYMELVHEFQSAYSELEESDQNKLLG